ncbi:MAG: hypothetical protein L3J14_01455 [Flavobacteriaceae bacterium]|nr:hypothetical protein [Flavobacteriaceae bacterium]
MKTLSRLNNFLLLVIFVSFISCGNIAQDPPVPKDKLISTKTAEKYIAQYNSIKYKAISEVTGKPDALEFYYTIAELEGYLAYVKKEANKQGIIPKGLAISLAAYPKDVHVKQQQNGLTTIILRPYGQRMINKAGFLAPPPNNDEIIKTISPMNDAGSTPPFD